MLNILFIPEIILSIGVMIIILFDLFFQKQKGLSFTLVQFLLLIAAYYSLNNKFSPSYSAYTLNEFTNVFKFILLVGSLAIFHYTYKHLKFLKILKIEYFTISLLGLIGTMIMISANSLLMLYLGIELLSLSLYALIGFNKKSSLSSEAAIKYYVLGAMSSGILLFGISLIYGFTGSIGYDDIASQLINIDINSVDYIAIIFGIIFITASLCFKFGAAPFHMWVPDIYQGSLISTTILLSTLPKIAVFIVFLKLYFIPFILLREVWSDILIFVGMLSIVIGSLFALTQENIKRLLAYSAISNIGFIILSLGLISIDGIHASLYYTVVYSLTALASFGIITHITSNSNGIEKITDLAGLSKTHPYFAFLILITMLSSAGIPPLIGFHAKLMVIKALISSSYIILSIIVVIMTVVSAYYYLKVIKTIYFDNREDLISTYSNSDIVLSINVLSLIALGIFPYLLFNLTSYLMTIFSVISI
ncbi:MAG: NADH-quinone oxidoreductase subunit N [Gammaproteobacteria bacterium]|jgi:NADH-quinone oxidoreductase subunit N